MNYTDMCAADLQFFPFFFFNDTATTEIYTLFLHDALPIWKVGEVKPRITRRAIVQNGARGATRSEEHTSELQSQSNLVCRLLLEKKKKNTNQILSTINTTVVTCTI